MSIMVILCGALWAAEKPNVVLFLADDLGYGDLGCYGGKCKTPNLDAFAAQGMRLTQCYAGSAVCSPSRSALMTGRTPHRNGVYTWIAAGSEVHLRKSEIAIPRLMKENGYATCHAGKWHLNGMFNSPQQPQPGDHGYDWWLATQNNAAPSHKNPKNFVRNGQDVGELQGFSAPLVAQEAISWLKERRDKDKPFFLAVCAHEPHLPIESDPKYMNQYPDVADADIRQYRGNVTQLDDAFGMLMKTLDELNETGKTLVWFTSDNGPEGNGNSGRTRGETGGLRGRKKAMYEGGIRVAGMVRWPGKIAAGSTSDVPVIGSDFFTTVCAATGIAPPSDRVLDGVNVLPVLTGKAASVERKVPLYWRLQMAPGPHLAMRSGDWKILADKSLEKFELYNIKDDPQEQHELSTKEADRFTALKKEFLELNASIEAEGPDWWKRLSDSGGGPKKAGANKKK